MEVVLKPWGNSTGIRFPKEFLKEANLSPNDTLSAEIINGRIVLTPAFRHLTLKERAAAYGGELRLSEEPVREEPAGNEVW